MNLTIKYLYTKKETGLPSAFALSLSLCLHKTITLYGNWVDLSIGINIENEVSECQTTMKNYVMKNIMA